MKRKTRIGRLGQTALVLFLIALVWNGILHMVVLRDANALIDAVRRTNLDDYLWISLLMTFAINLLFAFGYTRFARTGTVKEGVGYGVFFGLIAGVLVDLNQYVLYPIPGRLAFYWFLGGLLEFSLYGALITRLYPVNAAESANS